MTDTIEFPAWEDLTPLQQAATIYSDMHKDAHGFRPRIDTSTWTLADFEKEFAYLETVILEENAREAEAAKRNAAALETRIAEMIAMGAADRATAIRWLHDAYDTRGDDGYLEFELGLRYGYLKETA